MLDIDVLQNDPAWQDVPDAQSWAQVALNKAADHLGVEAGEVSIVLCGDAEISELNRQWRGQNKATNVLSFPLPEHSGEGAQMLGDIIISLQTTLREANDEAKPFRDHFSHLVVHGFLHLMGYDHETEEEAEEMETEERKILFDLEIPDPYSGTHPIPIDQR